MGLFRKEPTANEKNEIRSLIARAQTCARNLTEADKISSYFKEWDKLMSIFERLLYYERKGIKFKPSPKIDFINANAKKQRTEKNCIDRAYESLNVSLLSLKTNQGKINKATRFFDEMEYYIPRMDPLNADHVRQLKKDTISQLQSKPVVPTSCTPVAANYCPECGTRITPGAKFCTNCGTRLI